MKKALRLPALAWRTLDKDSDCPSQEQSKVVRVQPYDVRKAVLPRSLDLMLSLKYRRKERLTAGGHASDLHQSAIVHSHSPPSASSSTGDFLCSSGTRCARFRQKGRRSVTLGASGPVIPQSPKTPHNR